VQEVIEDGYNGILVDFFDHAQFAAQVAAGCRSREDFGLIRERARRKIITD
jgi:hypothetical protein